MSLVFAVALGAILLGVGVTIDMSSAYSTRAKIQTALDQTTLHAAQKIADEDYTGSAREQFYQNFDASELENLTLEFSKSDDQSSVTGRVRADKPLMFAGLFSVDNVEISVTSVANVVAPLTGPCIMALATSAAPGIIFNGGATIDAPNCEIHTHMTSGNSMYVNAGININVRRTCVAASNVLDNSGGQLGNMELNCAVQPNPFATRVPAPANTSCNSNGAVYTQNNLTLSPGTYCGWHNFDNNAGTVHFEPGLYVIRNGGWNVNGGTWTGDGVTFYFADAQSTLQFNSGVTATLKAPTSGDYAGVFITQAEGLSNSRDFILNDNEGFDFEGSIYLPSSTVIFNGGTTTRSRKMSIVAHKLVFNSTHLSIESGGFNQSGAVTSPYLSK